LPRRATITDQRDQEVWSHMATTVSALPDSEQLSHFFYKGLAGFRVTQGEYRIV